MTRSLLQVVGTDVPFVVALEGGYTMHVLADCMEAVALALLDQAEYSVVGFAGSVTSAATTKNVTISPDVLQPVVPETETASTVESLLPLLESGLVIDESRRTDSDSTTPISDRLYKARQALAMYWKEEEVLMSSTTPSSSSTLSLTAARCINKSIAAMQATNRWRAIGLCPCPLPTTAKKNTGQATRKPKTRNSKQTKKQTSAQQAIVKEDDDNDLTAALQSLSLGNN
jgi:hypothetical protein